MLVACITGPDFQAAKNQLLKTEGLCDAVEIRHDLIEGDTSQLITSLPLVDCKEIPTYHNFDETPEDLEALLASMKPAPIVKIATMANCITDSLRMLDLVRRHPHVAGMCMGPQGEITRILAPVYGSPLTFASVGPPAAPGQMSVEDLLKCYHFKRLSPSTKVFGLMGNPITQSPSHKTHNAYFREHGIDAVYVKMCVEERELSHFFHFVKRLDFKGLSVTIPYKERIFDFIDHFEEKAAEIGAVNTLTIGAEIVGSNTDADGAMDVLEKQIPIRDARIVILGGGGSSKAISYEAKKRGGHVTICSRRFGNLHTIPTYDVLITTLPVEVDHDPIPGSVVFDINFKREASRLIERARSKGCQVILGEEMFQAQAALQFARWDQIPS